MNAEEFLNALLIAGAITCSSLCGKLKKKKN